MSDTKLKIKDVYTSRVRSAEMDYNRSISLYEYLAKRRDEISSKIDLGLVAINGASLVGLITLLGSSGNIAIKLGLNDATIPWSAFSFALGLGLAGYGLVFWSNRDSGETSDAYVRVSSLEDLLSTMEMECSPENHKIFTELDHKLSKLPQVGFQYSNTAFVCRGLAIFLWCVGMFTPLGNAVYKNIQNPFSYNPPKPYSKPVKAVSVPPPVKPAAARISTPVKKP